MGEVRVSTHRERGSEISSEIFGLVESQTKGAAAEAAPRKVVHALGTHLAEGSWVGS